MINDQPPKEPKSLKPENIKDAKNKVDNKEKFRVENAVLNMNELTKTPTFDEKKLFKKGTV